MHDDIKDGDDLRGSDQALTAFNKEGVTKNYAGSTGLLFDQAMAQTRMAVCLTDPHLPDNPIVFCNRAFERLTGYSSEEILGRNCRFLQGSATDPEQIQRLRDVIRNEEVAVVEILNYRKDGSSFWNTLHLGPIYDENGDLKLFFGSQWDVTDIHKARADERHARAMSREISHRLKNVFAVIGGIVSITGRSMGATDVAKKMNERINALGRSYEPTHDDAAMGTMEIGQAIRSVLSPYDPENDRIIFEGNGMRSEPNAISVIGLTLHELATNATKYGALSNDEGKINVSWKHSEDRFGHRALEISWVERGGPRIDGTPDMSGTGFDIAQKLLGHSRGVLETQWEKDGLKAKIVVPLREMRRRS